LVIFSPVDTDAIHQDGTLPTAPSLIPGSPPD
jgi:hypothetical protein